jgi:hypothetical protein
VRTLVNHCARPPISAMQSSNASFWRASKNTDPSAGHKDNIGLCPAIGEVMRGDKLKPHVRFHRPLGAAENWNSFPGIRPHTVVGPVRSSAVKPGKPKERIFTVSLPMVGPLRISASPVGHMKYAADRFTLHSSRSNHSVRADFDPSGEGDTIGSEGLAANPLAGR